ncbi:fibronectin type III domain-containing protein [Ruminococcus sp.]|uniref:fibronectin type III domain-containing protein n=1 Tax=Ruminococcus sp. TaxID=41978 RepID=UPI001B1FDE3A|nr:fibronectin type III domain-containing protein [Ruminococcus sp.]MBO5559969.1 fibronectin type III domain-containing protein [Ruminococcus sp.]
MSFIYRKKVAFRKIAVLVMTLAVLFVMMDISGIKASALMSTKAAVPTWIEEKTFDSNYTHPYNSQIDTIILHWNKTKGASRYQVYIKGGKYKNWTRFCTTTRSNVTAKNLNRATAYQFRVRAVYSNNTYSAYSKVQNISTSRMNYDQAGWEAMCRIVYHEVGRINDDMWDKPIVYVADCVANRYVAAKYLNDPLWAPYYRNYGDIQSIIYRSGGFMSDRGLTNDGCNYGYVPNKVKQAVWGATYALPSYKGIKNDYTVFYWCNTSYYQSSYKIAYSFKIPWGYFSIWKEFWG